jgi:hypothetical protein
MSPDFNSVNFKQSDIAEIAIAYSKTTFRVGLWSGERPTSSYCIQKYTHLNTLREFTCKFISRNLEIN